MTCRHDRLLRSLAIIAGLVGLAACGAEVAEMSPVDQARRDLATGRPADAQVALKRLVESGTDRAEIAAYLGEAALARGDLAEANEWLAAGEFSNATMAHGYRMQGRLEMANGRLPDAGRAFDRALALDPQNPDLWVDIGRLRYQGGEQLQALAAADRAVELGPESPAALQFRGQLARDAHGMTAGARWFERALELQPDNLDLRVDLAATLGDAGLATEALEVLRGDAGEASSSPRGLYLQAVLAARGGKMTLSRTLLDRSGFQVDGMPAANLLSAIIDIEEGNFGTAAQTLDRLLQRQPDNPRVIDLLALALSRSGAEKELVHRFSARAGSTNGSAYLRTLVGRAYESLGDRVAAAALLDMATKGRGGLAVLPSAGSGVTSRDGDSAFAARDSIRAMIAKEQPGIALARARDLARRFPGSGDALALLGDAELAAGNFRAASIAYSRSATVRQPWTLAPRLASSLAEPDQSFAYFKAYAAGNPANGEAAAVLADAYAFRGDWAKAATLLDRAISLGHGRVPWVLSARSIAAMQLGESESALSLALAATELQPMNPYALSALIAALPEDEVEARMELSAKLRSVLAN